VLMESVSAPWVLVLIALLLFVLEIRRARLMDCAKTMFANATRVGQVLTAQPKAAKWLQIVRDMDIASKELAIVRRDGRATSVKFLLLALEIVPIADYAFEENAIAEAGTEALRVKVRNARQTALDMVSVFVPKSTLLVPPCNVLVTRDGMGLIALCPLAKMIAPTTVFATTGRATATSSGEA